MISHLFNQDITPIAIVPFLSRAPELGKVYKKFLDTTFSRRQIVFAGYFYLRENKIVFSLDWISMLSEQESSVEACNYVRQIVGECRKGSIASSRAQTDRYFGVDGAVARWATEIFL